MARKKRILPPVCGEIPLASKEIPLVSRAIPLVSKVPPIILPRFWGMAPQRGGAVPMARSMGMTPTEMGLLSFLTIALTAPVTVPIKAILKIAKEVAKLTDHELEREAMFEGIRGRLEDEKVLSHATADK